MKSVTRQLGLRSPRRVTARIPKLSLPKTKKKGKRRG